MPEAEKFEKEIMDLLIMLRSDQKGKKYEYHPIAGSKDETA